MKGKVCNLSASVEGLYVTFEPVPAPDSGEATRCVPKEALVSCAYTGLLLTLKSDHLYFGPFSDMQLSLARSTGRPTHAAAQSSHRLHTLVTRDCSATRLYHSSAQV